MSKKPLKTELHHWWPRTLAEYWAANDGMVSIIRPTGETNRAPPGAYGAITNAHHMKAGEPWSSTFEPIFNQPDGEVGDFVKWLSTLDTPFVATNQPQGERITAQHLEPDRREQLARITASLLARSPAVRYSIKLTVEYYRGQIGLEGPTANKTLVASNQQWLYDAYQRHMAGSGRWAILFSDEEEFIAGDGLFHNFPASQDALSSGLKLLLPILPTAMIVYMLPMGGHPSEPRLVTMRLSGEEVRTLNNATQVYSKDILFFRDSKPHLSEDFRSGEYRHYQYNAHDWIDSLLDDLSQYNLWGSSGAPGRCRASPYADAAQGNRRFESLIPR